MWDYFEQVQMRLRRKAFRKTGICTHKIGITSAIVSNCHHHDLRMFYLRMQEYGIYEHFKNSFLIELRSLNRMRYMDTNTHFKESDKKPLNLRYFKAVWVFIFGCYITAIFMFFAEVCFINFCRINNKN